ncbi:hypothetical protein VNI00_008478 [Paramarasmius palmivorus]|uniref:endo-1,4-beta-xylanase n=1 Tax=Paramarasmius palmivorus TaxID=297713 RepID=A0AAW0CY34_9AGAR
MARLLALFCLLPLLPYVLGLNPLKSYFTGGRYIGFFTNQARMTSAGSTYVSIAETNFNAATESNACKWETLEPSQNNFNWAACDYTAKHNQLASWVKNLQGSAVDNAMKNHALNEDGTIRSSVFSQQVGSDFIIKAFTYARAADPNAKLYYNDYNLEFSGRKQDGAYNLVKDLKSRGLIDGIGLQGHLTVGSVPSNLKATVQRFASLGIEVAFTELDIGTKSKDFAQQAKDYATVTTACVTVSGCVGITVGGVRDEESSSWRVGEYTLLWDTSYQPKPAASAVATAAAGGTGNSNPPTSTSATTGGSQPTNPPSSGTVPQWGQCGGIGWTGATTCVSPYTCVAQNAYYSQCI